MYSMRCEVLCVRLSTVQAGDSDLCCCCCNAGPAHPPHLVPLCASHQAQDHLPWRWVWQLPAPTNKPCTANKEPVQVCQAYGRRLVQSLTLSPDAICYLLLLLIWLCLRQLLPAHHAVSGNTRTYFAQHAMLSRHTLAPLSSSPVLLTIAASPPPPTVTQVPPTAARPTMRCSPWQQQSGASTAPPCACWPWRCMRHSTTGVSTATW
jgi:hypothetical protein